jgi:hypothetical protein
MYFDLFTLRRWENNIKMGLTGVGCEDMNWLKIVPSDGFLNFVLSFRICESGEILVQENDY